MLPKGNEYRSFHSILVRLKISKWKKSTVAIAYVLKKSIMMFISFVAYAFCYTNFTRPKDWTNVARNLALQQITRQYSIGGKR